MTIPSIASIASSLLGGRLERRAPYPRKLTQTLARELQKQAPELQNQQQAVQTQQQIAKSSSRTCSGSKLPSAARTPVVNDLRTLGRQGQGWAHPRPPYEASTSRPTCPRKRNPPNQTRRHPRSLNLIFPLQP